MALAEPKLVIDREDQSSSETDIPRIEFRAVDQCIEKSVVAGSLSNILKVRVIESSSGLSLPTQFAVSSLYKRVMPSRLHSRPIIRSMDLCAGSGGLSTGISQAVSALGCALDIQLAADISRQAELVYRKNLRPKRFIRDNIETLVRYSFLKGENAAIPDPASLKVRSDLEDLVGTIDLFCAGPPCEGHSNLNNVSRRSDTRNNLYLDAVATACAVEARVIAVENVPTVPSSHQDILNRARKLLELCGYTLSEYRLVLQASDFGCSQTRRRHFLIASKAPLSISRKDFELLKQPEVTLEELFADLSTVERCSVLDSPANLSSENLRRVKYLHDNDIYELPDEERPDCHKLKEHSYGAVYGRLYPDRPSPTITTGFQSPGRGRYTHPFEPRGLTLREGALIQGFPVSYDWMIRSDEIGRGGLSTMIGDAVPPHLGFAVGAVMMHLLDQQ